MAGAGKPEALPGDQRFRRGLWIRPADFGPSRAPAGDDRGAARPAVEPGAVVADEERAAFETGEAWLGRGRLKRAVPCFEAVGRGPLGTAAASYLGAIHAELGRFDQAEQWFRRALSGQGAFAQRGYGILLDITAHLGAGDKYTRWAADGKDGAAANHLGGSLVLRGFAGDGEARLRRAAEDCGHPAAMFRLALLLAARGDRSEAARWCDRAREAGDQTANCALQAFRVHAGELSADEAVAVKRPRATDGFEALVQALERRWGVYPPRNVNRRLRLAARENLDGMLALRLLSS
jgi:tetratricopeptide (TPR) repeat protein